MTDYSDDHLKKVLQRTKVVAVVGVSMNPVRPSYYVARYLGLKGYRVIPVNPGHAGKMLFGETVQASLTDIKAPVDMVDIFRRSEAVPPIVDEALEVFPELKTGVDADRCGKCRSSCQGRGARRHCDPEPLPQDRIPAPVRRTAHGRLCYRDHLLETVTPRGEQGCSRPFRPS